MQWAQCGRERLRARQEALGSAGKDPFFIRTFLRRVTAAAHPMELLPHSLLSARSSTILNAFALWEECIAGAAERFRSFDGEKLAVRFEDLVAEPSEVLSTIAHFCGRTFDDATPGACVSSAGRIAAMGSATIKHSTRSTSRSVRVISEFAELREL